MALPYLKPLRSPSRWRSAATSLPGAVLLLASLAGCSADSNTTDVQTTVTDAPDEISSEPTIVFDGTKCTYNGPDTVAGGGIISVTLQNTSDIDIDAALFHVRNDNSLQGAFDQIPPGEGSGISLGFPPGSTQEGWLQANAGGHNQEGLLLPEGLYLLDCARIPYGSSTPDYVWRAGSFEVVAQD